MFALILVGLAIETPPQAPPLEDRVKIIEAKVAALEAKCQCGPVAKTAVAQPAAPPMQTVCGPDGCVQVSASGQLMNQGGCSNGQCSPRGGFRLFGRRR